MFSLSLFAKERIRSCYFLDISITRLASCLPENTGIPTFIRYSPEYVFPLHFNIDLVPGSKLISFISYWASGVNPCKRTGCRFSAYRGWISKAKRTALSTASFTYITAE